MVNHLDRISITTGDRDCPSGCPHEIVASWEFCCVWSLDPGGILLRCGGVDRA